MARETFTMRITYGERYRGLPPAKASALPQPGMMRGTIERLLPTFGFIRGDDRIGRFFIPSGLQAGGVQFSALRVGMQVGFIHIDHPRGPRAIDILVLEEGRG